MRIPSGIVVCLLTGCAVQPPADSHAAAATTAPARAAPAGATLCIGVEFLPPENDVKAPEVERAVTARPERAGPRPTTLLQRTTVPEARHTWALGADELATIDDPLARTTLQFVDDLLREDRKRTERELRLPLLDWQPADLDLGQRLWSEEAYDETQREWISKSGRGILSRPFRKMLRRLPLVGEVEVSIDEFRSTFVPLSEPYRQAHARDRSLGRVSVRLHASDPDDPVEVVYIRSGFRIGSSQERAKMTIDWPLTEAVSLTLRTRRDWATSESRLRVDLAYRHSANTSFRVAVGDDMDFLSTSSVYSLFDSPMESGPGLLLYAVHIF